MPRMDEQLPCAAGSYALLFDLTRPVQLTIGRLGSFAFSPGAYLYLGSAGGSGGLGARVGHHLRITERPHWHLDWLRPHLEAKACFYVVGGPSMECVWARDARSCFSTRAQVPAPGFGASDCRQGCESHFMMLPEGFEIDDARRLLQDSSNRQVFVIMLSDSTASR